MNTKPPVTRRRAKPQRAISESLTTDRHATQAAIRAGYSPHTAAQQAARLLRDPRIREILEQQAQAKLRAADLTAGNLALNGDRPSGSETAELTPQQLGRYLRQQRLFETARFSIPPLAHPVLAGIASINIVRRRRKVVRTESTGFTTTGGRSQTLMVRAASPVTPAPLSPWPPRGPEPAVALVPPISKRGSLRHGNPPGDPTTAPRCGARTRENQPCRAPAIRGKPRCRMHGGRSTGPRTPAGRARSAHARWKHGAYTAAAERDYQQTRALHAAFNAKQQAYHSAVWIGARLLLKPLTIDRRNARRRRGYALRR